MSNKKLHKPWNGTCPACQTPKAYCGFNSNECVNQYCINYNSKHKASVHEYVEYLNDQALGYNFYDNGYYTSAPLTFDNIFSEYKSVDENSNDTNDSSNTDYDNSDQPLDIDFDGCPF